MVGVQFAEIRAGVEQNVEVATALMETFSDQMTKQYGDYDLLYYSENDFFCGFFKALQLDHDLENEPLRIEVSPQYLHAGVKVTAGDGWALTARGMKALRPQISALPGTRVYGAFAGSWFSPELEALERCADAGERCQYLLTGAVDSFQATMNVAGMIPIAGNFADAANGFIYFARGQDKNGWYSLGAAVPGLGYLSNAAQSAEGLGAALGSGEGVAQAVIGTGLTLVAGGAGARAELAALRRTQMYKTAGETLSSAGNKAAQHVRKAGRTVKDFSGGFRRGFSNNIRQQTQRLNCGVDPVSPFVEGINEGIKKASKKSILPDDVMRLAKKNIKDSGTTVLGSFRAEPGKMNYIQKAKARGSSYFDVGDAWDDLASRGVEWDANRYFLDVISTRGDDILLSIPKTDIAPGSYLSREIQYLAGEKGYHWINQWKMVAP